MTQFTDGWRSACKAVDAALKAGARLALLGRPTVPQGLSAGTFWVVAMVGLVLSGIVAWFGAEEPRQFSLYGLQAEGFYVLLGLLACYLVALACGQASMLWPLATLVFSAALVADTVMWLVNDHLSPSLFEHNRNWYLLVLLVQATWWIGIWHAALTTLSLSQNSPLRVIIAFAVVTTLTTVSFKVGGMRLWEKDYAAEYEMERAEEPPSLIAEEVFSRQPELIEGALARLSPGTPGKPDLYFIAFGPYGEQDVFMKESLYSTRLFETRFGAKGRTLTLVNNRERVNDLPLATATNLERSLQWLGANIDAEEDLVFLFLTSHGSKDAELSVRLEGLSFRALSATALAAMLRSSGIKWKVLVISGCYSGTFVDKVKDDHTLVIAAARADRTSFGCSDDAEFTYFGRAYFEHALNQTTSFVDAFDIAGKLVAEWEKRDKYTQSEPQMVRGKLIGAKLEEWQATIK